MTSGSTRGLTNATAPDGAIALVGMFDGEIDLGFGSVQADSSSLDGFALVLQP